ncbi:hypothetical protein INT47_002644, partial [Mucor saturninus]
MDITDKVLYSKNTTYRANGELHKDSNLKPDFVVYTISFNVKFILVLGEFKNAANYTAIESDRVKLGKQMRTVYNELVIQRVSNPAVCGIICQGDDIMTYIIDLYCPQLYRMIKMSKAKLFRSLEEFYDNIALHTTLKAEVSMVEAMERNHRNSSKPPETWLTFESHRLCRKRKRKT